MKGWCVSVLVPDFFHVNLRQCFHVIHVCDCANSFEPASIGV